MMNYKKALPVLIAIATFVIVSVAYFSPVLDGKKIEQSDIRQFIGMSKGVNDFRTENNEEPYWTNRAFSGMPTYQLSSYYPNDYIKKLDSILRFLPRPADYLFLYFLSFFVLLTVLKTEYKLAILGALAFGFSTYFIIILGVGHNAKAHAIAYMPLVLAGILLVFQKKYFIGFLLTAIAMALEIGASHIQMTYYLLFVVLFLGVFYLTEAIKKKTLLDFAKQIALLLVAVILGVGMNATSLMATKEYAANSTRSKSELTFTPDGQSKKASTGLSKDYITEYSYGKLETFNLLIPRFMGGANSENLGRESETYQFLKGKVDPTQAKLFAENVPAYWGKQPIVAAPAYIGAVLLFLFVLGIFLVKGKLKKWLVTITIFSILLSWGKNFNFLTDLFIDFMPMYNKFRAVSSIQVITELAVPLLAILGLKAYFSTEKTSEEKLKALKNSFFIVGGFALLFTLFGISLFAFEGLRDGSYDQMLPGLTDAIIADRKHVFFMDSLRSFVLITVASAILFLVAKKKLKSHFAIYAFIALIVFDLVNVDKRYVNNDDFVRAVNVDKPFKPTQIDQEILKDKSQYRVANFLVDPFTDGSTSYFHNSIGGYHAAKPRRYQELYDYQFSKNNMEVFHMLNIKYIQFPDNQGKPSIQLNTLANGNAWFVSDVLLVATADEEMKALDSLDSKNVAVINKIEFSDIIKNDLELPSKIDSTATIVLTDYKENALTYKSKSKEKQLAVFSEMYYKDGWNAYVDGEKQPHLRANYVLRALVIPEGEHTVVFKFEPTVIKKGNVLTLASYGILLLILLGWGFKLRKNYSKV